MRKIEAIIKPFKLDEVKEGLRSKSLITVDIGCGHGDYSIELAQYSRKGILSVLM